MTELLTRAQNALTKKNPLVPDDEIDNIVAAVLLIVEYLQKKEKG